MAGWDWQGVPQAWVIEIQKVLDFYGLDILTFSMINLSFIYQTNKTPKELKSAFLGRDHPYFIQNKCFYFRKKKKKEKH